MRMPRYLISGLCSAVAAPVPLAATAHELPAAQWNIVPEQTLAQMRGGMDLGQLVASFAMDRVVEVNGAVVAQAHLAIANLDQLGKGGMPTISVSGPLAQVVQVLSSGAVNVVTPLSSGTATTANAATADTPVVPNVATTRASNASSSVPSTTSANLSNASSSVPNTTAANLTNASSSVPNTTAASLSTASPSATSVTPSNVASSTASSAGAPSAQAPAASAQASQGVGPEVAPTASTGATVVASATTGSSVPLTPGQAVAPSNLPTNAAIGTAVQNSLNSAMIQAQTTISASLNSVGQLNSMTLADAIRQQVYAGH